MLHVVAPKNLRFEFYYLRPCVLQLSVSPLVFLRYKDGCEIQPSDNITLQADGTMRRLIIRSAETSDAGSYTCQAGNNSIDFTVNVRGTGTVLTLAGPSSV